MPTTVVVVTAEVVIVKVLAEAPAATVTVAGTLAAPGLALDSVTCTPPVGAAAVSVTVPVEDWPPTTLDGLAPSDASAAAGGGGGGVPIGCCQPSCTTSK